MTATGTYHPTPCQRCHALITHSDTLWRADGTGGVWFDEHRQPNHMRCIKNGGGTNEMERMMNMLAATQPNTAPRKAQHVAYCRGWGRAKTSYLDLLRDAVEAYRARYGEPVEALCCPDDLKACGLSDGSDVAGVAMWASARVHTGVVYLA